jgi:hypothetical protein
MQGAKQNTENPMRKTMMILLAGLVLRVVCVLSAQAQVPQHTKAAG